jgi:hypothetical protein
MKRTSFCHESPQKRPRKIDLRQADARTRTGDPFITRERRVEDARPLAGMRGYVFAGDKAISRLCQCTGVSARVRAHVPVLYPASWRSRGLPVARSTGLADVARRVSGRFPPQALMVRLPFAPRRSGSRFLRAGRASRAEPSTAFPAHPIHRRRRGLRAAAGESAASNRR